MPGGYEVGEIGDVGGEACRRDSSTAVVASPCIAIAPSVQESWGVAIAPSVRE